MPRISQILNKIRIARITMLALSVFCLIATMAYALEGQKVAREEVTLLDALKDNTASLRGEELAVPLLLRGIGKQAGINIFVADDITETINIDVEALSLYEMFHVVMDAKQLSYYQKNNVLFVEKRGEAQAELRDMETVRLCTEFGNADSYIEQLKTLLTPKGSIMAGNRNSCLIVRDNEKNIPRIREMLEELDQPIPQVHIEARIVVVTDEAKKQLGVVWGVSNYKDAAAQAFKTQPITGAADLSITEKTSNISFGIIKSNLNLNVDIQAMEKDSLLEILSAPSILVLDGTEAEIKQGQEVPYVSQSGDLINTSFREANLGLKVKPTVLKDNFLTLEIEVTNDSVDQTTTADGEPLINKQEITTNLFLEDNVTVVIGGIVQENKNNSSSKVPLLGDIPVLGNLFKNNEKKNTKQELLVFITPQIVKMPRRSTSMTDRELASQDVMHEERVETQKNESQAE